MAIDSEVRHFKYKKQTKNVYAAAASASAAARKLPILQPFCAQIIKVILTTHISCIQKIK